MIRMLIDIALNRNLVGDPRWIRCARCGTIGSEGSMRIQTKTRYRHGQLVDYIQTPPEWTCPGCGRGGPLEVGELLTNDTLVRCRRTFLCRYVWKVPGSLRTVVCPRCCTEQPGPGAARH